MSERLQRHALDELLHEGRYLYPAGVVGVLERSHVVDGPGVPRAVVESYAAEAFRRLGPRAPFGPERFRQLLERRVTDLHVWLPNTVYEVAPGRLSGYPSSWHERLTGVRDPVEYVRVLGADLAAASGDDEPTTVPKSLLLDAMMVFGDVDRRTAGGAVTGARLRRRIRVEPRTNPEADVWLVPSPTGTSPETPSRTAEAGDATRPRP